jgi:hypothetical protein
MSTVTAMTPAQYLEAKGMEYREANGQLVTHCVFADCDKDSKGPEAHLYVEVNEGLYLCHKCGAKGNLVELAKHFGDDPKELGFYSDDYYKKLTKSSVTAKKRVPVVLKSEDVEKWHADLYLNEGLMAWLKNERGLNDDMIGSAKLGFDGKHFVIPIPDGKGGWLYPKRRVMPWSTEEPKYLNARGAKAVLYGSEFLKDATHAIICEGELDSLLLRSFGMIAVSSTGGAGTFEQGWAKLFATIPNVFIIYDHDDAGRQGALHTAKMIPHARLATLPSEVGDGGDVTDFLVKLKKSPDDLWEILKAGRSAEDIMERGIRYSKMQAPDRPVTITDWRETINKHFPECLSAAEVGLSVVAQLLINDVHNPFGLVYVDVPSAGKTITLNFFSEIQEIAYDSDNFTPASLVSHASNRTSAQLENVDLLPRIRFRTLVVRDLAPIFAERQENLLKNLGVLTRVFDGEGYESDSGVHGKRGYRGDYTFMFLAGSTPIAPRVWRFMGSLGSRLFFLNMNVPDKSTEELADLLVQNDFKKKEKACRKTTRDHVLTLWNAHVGGVDWDKSKDPVELRLIISRCAELLARLRGTLDLWSEKEDQNADDKASHSHTNVVIEKPMRINQLLYNLARGHALACGRTQLTEEDMWPVIEVTLNSAQMNRTKFMEALIEAGGTMLTRMVESAINCSNPTALREIESFNVLGIAHVQDERTGDAGRPEKIISLKAEFDWFTSDECKHIRAMRPGSDREIT